MRVLVTRPEESGAATAGRLRALGHEPVLLPLFVARHLALGAETVAGNRHGGVILTSAEAIRALRKSPETLQALRLLPAYAVGKATARAATAAGFAAVETASGDGRALARLISALPTRAEGSLLYLAGEPRSPHLEAGLKQAGIPFETRVVYRMEAIDYREDQLAEAMRDTEAVLLYSRETALRFALMFRETGIPARTRFLCLSKAIAASLPEEWSRRADIAPDMSEQALLACLAGP